MASAAKGLLKANCGTYKCPLVSLDELGSCVLSWTCSYKLYVAVPNDTYSLSRPQFILGGGASHLTPKPPPPL